MQIPEILEKGEYIFLARAVSGREIVLDSESFEVGERFSVAAFLRSNILFLIIILVAISMAIFMMQYHKSREKLRLLNLYLMMTELNKLVKKGKYDEAIEIYIRIKAFYGESVSRTALQNKEALKQEMQKLSSELDTKVLSKFKAPAENSQKQGEGKKEKSKKTEAGKEENKNEDKADKSEEDKKPKENKEESQAKDSKEPKKEAGEQIKTNKTESPAKEVKKKEAKPQPATEKSETKKEPKEAENKNEKK